MVSKSQIKLITSLAQKKYRYRYKLFAVEGVKAIDEFLNSSLELHSLYALQGSFEMEQGRVEVSPAELKKISFLKTPQKALALFHMPENSDISDRGLTLVLDEVRDPGNLGTLIRLCDWYGIENLVCSVNTVDCFNPKVVQATMGSLTRLNITYQNLTAYLHKQNRPVYGAFMSGHSVYKSALPQEALLVLGNEAQGISGELQPYIQYKISIPQFGSQHTESLNVAVAASILVSEFKRTSPER